MDESFGARLRLQRERQQVALATIAEQTKIKLSLLEGLERDDVSHWPEGIFRRAFVRSYARAIGLEPDVVVREFLALHPDSVEVIPDVFAAAPSPGSASVSRRPPMRLRYLVASAFSALRDALLRVQRRGPAIVSVTVGDRHSFVQHQPVSPKPDLSTPLEREAVSPDTDTDLSAAAHLCTSLGRVLDARDVAPLLEDAAKILDAVGLVVWSWEPRARALEPAVAHGYSEAMLAQFPRVRRDSDNAIAAAFRSAETRIVNGEGQATGAVVVPLMAPRGCVGVLALELRHGGEQSESVRAMATIMAAQLANVVGSAPMAAAVNA
jgi:helix-turn-helix protein/GAF domain-containing protein